MSSTVRLVMCLMAMTCELHTKTYTLGVLVLDQRPCVGTHYSNVAGKDQVNSYGTLIPLGDIDFYPNAGGLQPGCRDYANVAADPEEGKRTVFKMLTEFLPGFSNSSVYSVRERRLRQSSCCGLWISCISD